MARGPRRGGDQHDVLLDLHEKGATSVLEVAPLKIRSKVRLSLDALEAQGLIERVYMLTDEGLQALAKLESPSV